MLQVSLPTNFKAARFKSDKHTAILRRMQADIEAIRFDPGDGAMDPWTDDAPNSTGGATGNANGDAAACNRSSKPRTR